MAFWAGSKSLRPFVTYFWGLGREFGRTFELRILEPEPELEAEMRSWTLQADIFLFIGEFPYSI